MRVRKTPKYKKTMLSILPIDVKEGRSSTMVSASSSWTYKKALKKRKLTASQMYVFHHIIRTHTHVTHVPSP